MAKVIKERMTATPEDSFVLFLIGMRVNNWFAIHRWLPVFLAMGPMLKELHIHRDLGFKSYEMAVGRTLIIMQYWESSEKLIAYAKASGSNHLPAWGAYNRRARKTDAVGIWHETYVIEPGKTESVYANMPPFGFGKVGKLQPALGKRNTAKERLTVQ